MLFRNFSLLTFTLFSLSAPIVASQETPASNSSKLQKDLDFETFTGKVTRPRVRMRLQPNLDAYVYKELNPHDLVLVTGSVDDFYAVAPPEEVKGYVFRTYVLDGVVEGNNVNVRLEPDLAAPVICQLNNGDAVYGTLASQNSKWLQIPLPSSVRFYIAKNFVVKAGDSSLFVETGKRKKQFDQALGKLNLQMEEELKKPFREIALAPLVQQLNVLVQENQDLPNEVKMAKELIARMQKAYLDQSLIQTDQIFADATDSTEKQTNPPTKQHEKEQEPTNQQIQGQFSPGIGWIESERKFLKTQYNPQNIVDEENIYIEERKNASLLQGVIRPYDSMSQKKPGDFVIVNPKTNAPYAYLYSTKVNLKDYVGKNVQVFGALRPNNNFAFQAYFVLELRTSPDLMQ